ncbi:MAG: hypothetical protein J7M03_01265 [Candidatus Desulfofervidaceae bacterium]|nr:hypothetical protein [Candidatus Desulfofervidaceae bacterium]
MWKLNQNGIALVSTLSIGIALVVLGLLLFAFARIESNLSKQNLTQSQAFWQAEAGLQMGHWWLQYTDVLREDVTDKSVVIKAGDDTFLPIFDELHPATDNWIYLTQKTEGVTEKGGIKFYLISKASVSTCVEKGKTKKQTLKEKGILTLPGSLGHGVAIGAGEDIYYVDPTGSYRWGKWHHKNCIGGGCCKYHYYSETLAEVKGEVEIGNQVALPPGLFDSLDTFKDYFKGRQMVIRNESQSFYDGTIPKDEKGNDVKLIFVDGDIHLYGNWSNKNITFVATGSIYLDTQVEKGRKCRCKKKSYEPVTTGDTGRLTLIAYNKYNNDSAVVITGSDSSNIINGIICCRDDVEFKGVSSSSTCGCWCHHKTEPSGGIFKGTILAQGKVKLGVNWTIYYDAQVITGDIVEPRLGLSYGFNYDLKRVSWSEL